MLHSQSNRKMCWHPRSRYPLSKWYSPFIDWVVNVDALSTPATLALRTLIQLNPGGYAKYIHLLAQSLGEIHSSPARAEIIWLVGEFASQLGGRAPDVLRLSLQDFADQVKSVSTKLTSGRRCQVSDHYFGCQGICIILS
jgi:hypothetical protein